LADAPSIGEYVAVPDKARLSPENRRLLIAFAGVLALVFAFVGSNVAANHHPKPHDLPVGAIGPPQAAASLSSQLNRAAPGAYEVHAYGTPEAAQTAIRHRKVYGAFQAGNPATLFTASAASRSAAQILEKTFQNVARAQGKTLEVHDVVPLPQSDSSGATSPSAILSLIIAGVLGTSFIYMATQGRPLAVRLRTVVALGICAGFVTALVTNVIVDAFPGQFPAVWVVAALFVLAIALPVAAFQVLLGIAGTGVGLLVFIVIGNPASGGSSAPELLPAFWRAISQLLPPGAGATAMRDSVYFDGHGAAWALIVLALYAVLGLIGAIVFDRIKNRRAAHTVPA
jgi:hypothetical protein